jgi:hypothetical protein
MPDPGDSFFKAQAVNAFQFLVSEYGFGSPSFRGPIAREPAMQGDDLEIVRFESSKVFVSIARCPSRLDWGVDIGLLIQPPDQENGFTLDDLAVGNVPDDGRRWTAMWPDKLLAKALAERAQILREYGHSALLGNASTFEILAEARSMRVRQYSAQQRVASATSKADAAFRRKDWTEVVNLLAPFSANLPIVQRKKLDYARKQGRRQ